MFLLDTRPADAVVTSVPADSIRYLSLEGSGGKGFAYLGALDALHERRVLVYEGDHGLLPVTTTWPI